MLYERPRTQAVLPENVVDRSRSRRLAAEGFKQVTLLGQNVNSYRYDDYDFASFDG